MNHFHHATDIADQISLPIDNNNITKKIYTMKTAKLKSQVKQFHKLHDI